eukprot:gene3214-14709_t
MAKNADQGMRSRLPTFFARLAIAVAVFGFSANAQIGFGGGFASSCDPVDDATSEEWCGSCGGDVCCKVGYGASGCVTSGATTTCSCIACGTLDTGAQGADQFYSDAASYRDTTESNTAVACQAQPVKCGVASSTYYIATSETVELGSDRCADALSCKTVYDQLQSVAATDSSPATCSDSIVWCGSITSASTSQWWSDHTNGELSEQPTCSDLVTCLAVNGEYWSNEQAMIDSAQDGQFVSDRQCSARNACADNEFIDNISEQGGDNNANDNTCTALDVCDTTLEFQATAPTPTSDRECQTAKVCEPDEYEYKELTSTTDRGCALVTTCDATTTYTSKAANATSNTECTPLTACLTGETEVVAETSSSDRICTTLCTPATAAGGTTQYWSNYYSSPGVVNSDYANNVWSVAPVCATLAVCSSGSGTFWSNGGSGEMEIHSSFDQYVENRVCSARSECGATQFISNGNAQVGVNNQVDNECTDGTTCSTGTYESTPLTAYADSVCSNTTTCDGTTKYETVAATPTSDATCTLATKCQNFEYESTALSVSVNRVCTSATVCDGSATYETAALTPTTNRQCSAVTACDGTSKYQTAASTSTSNTVCLDITECASDEHETLSPTSTRNRVCQPNPSCVADAFVQNDCEIGFTVKGSLPTEACAGSSCTNDECCDPNPSCSSSSFVQGACDAGYTVKPSLPTTPCTGSSCISTDCCTQNPSCVSAGFVQGDCNAGYTVKGSLPTGACTGSACTNDECCDPNPSCSSSSFVQSDCNSGATLIAPSPSTACADSTCISSECCEVVPKCYGWCATHPADWAFKCSLYQKCMGCSQCVATSSATTPTCLPDQDLFDQLLALVENEAFADVYLALNKLNVWNFDRIPSADEN